MREGRDQPSSRQIQINQRAWAHGNPKTASLLFTIAFYFPICLRTAGVFAHFINS